MKSQEMEIPRKKNDYETDIKQKELSYIQANLSTFDILQFSHPPNANAI